MRCGTGEQAELMQTQLIYDHTHVYTAMEIISVMRA